MPAAPGRGRRVAVVLNSNALKVNERVVAALASITPGEDLYLSHDLDDARRIARLVVERRYDTVLFGGGDGTLVRGLELLAAASTELGLEVPAIGVLRLGTGNAFADAVGAAPLTLDGLVADVMRARAGADTRKVPMLAVLGRLTPFCGFGVDAQILEDHDEVGDWMDRGRFGHLVTSSALRYLTSVGLRSLPRFVLGRRARVSIVNLGSPAQRIGPDGKPSGAPVPAGEVLWAGSCTMAACATIPFFGMALKMFPFAELRKDRFQLRAGDPSTIEMLVNLRKAFKGTYFSPHTHDFLCDRIALEMDSPQPFEVGGELIGRQQRVEVALGRSFDVT